MGTNEKYFDAFYVAADKYDEYHRYHHRPKEDKNK
jgi:hypothetical protein